MKIPLKIKLQFAFSYGAALGLGMLYGRDFPEEPSLLWVVVFSILLWISLEIVDEIDERKNAFVTRTLWHEDGRKIVLVVPNMDGKSEFARAAFLLNQVKGQL